MLHKRHKDQRTKYHLAFVAPTQRNPAMHLAKYTMEEIAITFDTARVRIFPTSTVIEYPDGTSVYGEPENTERYRQTAHDHGYGDTLHYCIDHEIMHVALENLLGYSSPTMQAVRLGDLDQQLPLRELEEAAVLAIQRYTRAAGIDLVKRFQASRQA